MCHQRFLNQIFIEHLLCESQWRIEGKYSWSLGGKPYILPVSFIRFSKFRRHVSHICVVILMHAK